MATGLQYRETLNIISGGYPGEGVGSSGVTQDWADVGSLSGTSTVTYWYHDSATVDDANSTVVSVNITDNWVASINPNTNDITVRVLSHLNSITRTVAGSPSPLSVSIFVRRAPGQAVLWSESCVDAAINASYINTPVNLGITEFVLHPGDSTQSQNTIYYRNNVCGYDDEPTPSTYVDEYGVGISFRNVLPTPVTFSLNYDANGGTGAPAAQTATAVDSATFTVSNASPSWGSYEFLGWSRTRYTDSRTEADVEYRAGDTITLQRANPSLTLYAVWRMTYVPGKTYQSSDNTWYSHNRKPGGAAKLWNGSSWTSNMETINGPTGTNDPPIIKHNDAWHNMRKIGHGA